MSGFRWILVGFLVLGLATTVTADHHEALMEEVRTFGDDLEAAMLAEDVDTMLAMYAEGAISLPNYGPRMDGIDEFRAHHEQMAAAGMKVRSFQSDPADVWQAGDQVIEIGVYQIELEMPGMPGMMTDRGKYLTVYLRDADGALKIAAETWNTDVNPMDMMGGDAGHDAHAGHDGQADE